jgi:predicted Ser/Thr protein kinase
MSFPLLLSTDGRSLHAETEAIIKAQFMSVKRLFNLFSFNVSQSVSQSVISNEFVDRLMRCEKSHGAYVRTY